MGCQNGLFLLSLFVTFGGALGGDYCYRSDYSELRWCTYGCCGYLDTDCCDANVALIVGMTVLAVIVVSTIIAVICCCMRRRAAAGQVLNPNPNPGMVVVANTGQTSMMATPGQPMPYNTQAYQPGVFAPPTYPMGQAPPPGHPYGGPAMGAPTTEPMAPPSYGYVAGGGQENPAFDYKPVN